MTNIEAPPTYDYGSVPVLCGILKKFTSYQLYSLHSQTIYLIAKEVS
jgi:hypothetical protein